MFKNAKERKEASLRPGNVALNTEKRQKARPCPKVRRVRAKMMKAGKREEKRTRIIFFPLPNRSSAPAAAAKNSPWAGRHFMELTAATSAVK